MKTMKLTNKFAATAFAALALAFATSCSEDSTEEPKKQTEEPTGDKTEELAGDLAESKTLKADVAYTVTGAYKVKAGATLTIPAGTVITSKEGTDNVIAVEMGGKIDVQGTKDKPVVMKGQGNSGDWGGLVVCGKGETTKGNDVNTEIGGLTYGGDDNTDNSGSIKYLIIKDSGASLDTKSEFNGLSLYTVGSGTTIDNVAVIGGADDGIEFFGGAVKATNIYLENNEDDSVDWTQGWSGSIENVYVKLEKAFDSAVEGDGNATKPVIKNLTAVSTKDGQGVVVQNASAATFTGLTLTGFDATKSFVSLSSGVIANSTVDGDPAKADGVYASSTTKADAFSWVAGK